MRRAVLLVLLVLLVPSALGVLGASAAAQEPGPTVRVVDNAYEPPSVTVVVGTTVRWEWTGTGTHTVSARDASFRSGQKGQGGEFATSFRTAGRYEYFCEVHGDFMSGVVTVQAQAAPSSPSPSAAPRSAVASPTGASVPPSASPGRSVTTPSTPSPSPFDLVSLDETPPRDRTGLAIALGLVISAAGIGTGATLLLRGRPRRAPAGE